MARQTVNIELRAGGGNQVAGEFGKAAKASQDFVVNIKKIGNVFGELGGTMGDLVSNIAKGGIWGIMNAAVAGAQKLLDSWLAKQEQVEERAATAAQKAYDKRMQAAMALQDKMNVLAQSQQEDMIDLQSLVNRRDVAYSTSSGVVRAVGQSMSQDAGNF